MNLVVKCEPPLKHGQTWIPCAVFTFNDHDKAKLEMPFFSDKELTDMLGEKLKDNLSGPVHKQLATILQVKHSIFFLYE